MARGRLISKSLSTSEKYAALHEADPALAEFCQSLYPLLVAHADDFGRLAGDPFSVRLVIMPTSPRVITEFRSALQQLDGVGLIHWYEVGGRKYIQIQRFDEHQPGLHKRTSSRFPAPPIDSECFPEITGQQEQEQEEKRTQDQRSITSSKAVLGAFEVFWQAYPRKDAKEAAKQVWIRLAPDEALLAAVLAAVKAQRLSDQWTRDGGKFIPHARTWLNQRRWLDELAGGPSVVPAAPRICSRRHEPPCVDEASCTRRYLAGLRSPVEAQA